MITLDLVPDFTPLALGRKFDFDNRNRLEQLEEAYKLGLLQRTYVPVSPQNIFEKLAACQPLDSDEYRAIEEALVSSFREDLDDLSDLMGNTVE